MKKLRLSLLNIVLVSFIFSMGALAADSPKSGQGSLSNFTIIRNMSNQTFNDVKLSDWFFSGVKSTYDFGIMEGTGGGRFSPSGNVTLAEVITIASRVHSKYYGTAISGDSGKWYEKYYTYAKANNLLPTGITDATDIENAYATRAETAYLFSRLIGQDSLKTVNNATVPDIDQIQSEFKDSVLLMYSSGVIGGKPGGYFDGLGLSTRAEISVIISRLLQPSERLSFDNSSNQDIIGQECNIQNMQGMVISGNGCTYFIYGEYGEWYIVKRSGGKTEILYDAGADVELYNLTIKDGDLYFAQIINVDSETNSYSVIKKLNTKTKEITDLYSTKSNDPDNITYTWAFCLYDSNIYVLNFYIGYDYDNYDYIYKLEFGKVKSKSEFNILYSKEIEEKNISSFNNLSVYNQKAYFDDNENLYVYDMASKKAEIFIPGITAYSLSADKIYYVDKTNAVYKAPLNDISAGKLIYKSDISKTGNVQNVSYFNKKVYITFSGVNYILSLDEAGGQSVINTELNPFYVGFFNDGIIYSQNNDSLIAGEACFISNSTNSSVPLGNWLFSHPGEAAGSTLYNKLPKPAVSGKMLSSTEIFNKCSPAVFSIEVFDKDNNSLGTGSGFFISEDGIAVTNHHVYEGADHMKIKLINGNTYTVTSDSFLGDDEAKDILIFKVSGGSFSHLDIGSSEDIESGDKVYAIGSPMGLANTISEGIVSNAKREVTPANYSIQITTPITFGSSGGALINEYGQVIGITYSGMFYAGGDLNFAVPIEQIYAVDEFKK